MNTAIIRAALESARIHLSPLDGVATTLANIDRALTELEKADALEAVRQCLKKRI